MYAVGLSPLPLPLHCEPLLRIVCVWDSFRSEERKSEKATCLSARNRSLRSSLSPKPWRSGARSARDDPPARFSGRRGRGALSEEQVASSWPLGSRALGTARGAGHRSAERRLCTQLGIFAVFLCHAL
ncbi:hypothetical protein SKAU_G00003640 [Synaphobranchus kaupii]|uniref:Uncharacterized protein n=1 Tax=Synaphobranchus kaupii TaxID=118154 RepID=A0A9Q1JAI7_SYNKA|nr:hypothetical protein SKAU_G00003640 [Synaphobranchus kaupii]